MLHHHADPAAPSMRRALSTFRYLFCKQLRRATTVALLTAAWSLVFCAATLQAQPNNIAYPGNSIDSRLRTEATVDPTTGALQFEITLGNYAGRNGVSLPVTLHYSSKLWQLEHLSTVGGPGPGGIYPYDSVYGARYSASSAAGWTSNLDWFVWPTGEPPIETYNDQGQPADGRGNFRVARMYARLPDGSRHELRRDDNVYSLAAFGDGGGTYYAVDGSGLRYETATGTLFMPDGSRYVGGQYIDRHGNTLNYDSTTRQWTDTLGRTFVLPPLNTSEATDRTYTLPGIGGTTLTYTLRWRQLADVRTDSGQALRSIGDRVSRDNCQVVPSLFTSPDALCGGDDNHRLMSTPPFNPVVLHQIELPNGQTYTFTYNIYGEIDKVVYPTGGSERFTHGQVATLSAQFGADAFQSFYAQGNRGVGTRRVSPTNSPADEAVWSYGITGRGTFPNDEFARVVTAPDGTRTVRWLHRSRGNPSTTSTGYYPIANGFDDPRAGLAYEESVYSSTDQMLRRRLTQYDVDGVIDSLGVYRRYKTRNPRPVKEVEILLDTGGTALATITTNQYNQRSHDRQMPNLTSSTRYGFASVDQATAQTGGIASFVPDPNLVLQTVETSYLNDPNYTARNLIGLPISTTIKDSSGNQVARTEMLYDEAGYLLSDYGAVTGWSDPGTTARGLVTTTRQWLNIPSETYLETHARYDQCGSVRAAIDLLGRESQIEYSADYQRAYPTRTTSPVPDPSEQRGSNTPLVTQIAYDFSTGLVTSQTDANNRTTSFQYNDALNRLTRVDRPDGGWTSYNYFVSSAYPSSGTSYVQTRTSIDATRSTESYQFFDGLGRPARSFPIYEPGRGWQTTDTQYDALGRVWRVSNPYYTPNGAPDPVNPTGLWTTTGYDALGRVATVQTPDNAVVNTTYSGNTVTVSDQVNRARRSVTDALGRLIQVVEDPNGLAYSTEYLYDTLGNLRRVAQGGQQRFFMYDSLSRLIRARNPEQATHPALEYPDPVTGNTSWTMAYGYDANGNLTARVDARNVTTSYQYDQINRLIRTDYSDGTPFTLMTYDFATNGRGRYYADYESSTSGNRNFVTNYDAVGRPLRRTTAFYVIGSEWTGDFVTQRTYDRAGNVLSQTYPSGRTVTYQYDNAGRTNHVEGNLGDATQRTYSTGIQYDAASRMQQEQFGTNVPLYNKRQYNVRGQMAGVRLSTVSDAENWNRGRLTFFLGSWGEAGESGPQNNGNVWGVRHWIPADDAISSYSWVQENYEYDELNRVTRAYGYHYAGQVTQHYTQAFQYDRFGNRQIDAGQTSGTGINSRQFTIDSATNRLGVPSGQPGTICLRCGWQPDDG